MGSVTLRQLRLNPSTLNEALTGKLTFQGGTIQEAILTIDGAGGGNDHCIRLEGIEVKLAAPGEETTIFYDVIEEQDNTERPSTPGKAIQLGRNIFETGQSLDKDSLGQQDPALLAHKTPITSKTEMSGMLGQFTIEMNDLRISIQGAQAYERLVMVVPNLLIYRTPGPSQRGTVNFPEGLRILWCSRETLVELGGVNYLSFELDINSGVHVTGRGSTTLIPVDVLVRLEEMMAEYWSDWKTALGPKVGPVDDHLSNWTIDLEEIACSLMFVEERLCFTSKRITKTMDSLNELGVYELQCTNGTGEKGQFTCDSINIKFTNTGLNIIASPMRLSRLKINELREKLKGVLSLLPEKQSSQGLAGPLDNLIILKVESLQLDSIELQDWRFGGHVSQMEITYSPSQLSMHASQLQIEAFSNGLPFRMQLARASIYVSPRPSSSSSDDALEPFNEICLLIEGREFIACKTNPEDYFLMKSTVLDSCQEHVHISADHLTLSGPLIDTFIKNQPSSTDLRGERRVRCVTASLKQFSLESTELGGTLDTSDLEGLLLLSNSSVRLFDCRLNVQQATLREEILLKAILTASLDPHFKSVIFTGHTGHAISIFCCGLLFTIPLFHAALADLSFLNLSPNQTEGQTKLPTTYFQADLCSYSTLLPEPHQRQVPPHVLYIEGVRLIGEEPQIVFLTEGELFLAPGVGLTRPVTGLFPEGHNFWVEQNYESVFRFDFVTMTLTMPKAGSTTCETEFPLTLGIEDNEMTVELCIDSLQVLERLMWEYAELLKEQRGRLPDTATANSDDHALDKSSMLEGLDDTRPQGVFPFDEEIALHGELGEEDNWKIEDEFCTLGSPGDFDLNELIELPFFDDFDEDNEEERQSYRETGMRAKTHSRETLDTEEACVGELECIDRLEIEEDYFIRRGHKTDYSTIPDAFPFTSLPATDKSTQPRPKLRVCLNNFNIKVRLLDGRQWDPNRPQHVIERYPYGSSSMVSSYASSAHLAVSPNSVYASTSGLQQQQQQQQQQSHGPGSHQKRASVTTATNTTSTESRWSHLQGSIGTAGRALKSSDHVILQLDDISAELDFSDPFPASKEDNPKEADLTMITGVRLVIRDIAILDQVRSSRWRHLLKRAAAGHSKADPLFKLSLETLYVPMTKPSEDDENQGKLPILAPEDQLESRIRVQLGPLRAYIDQDTLVFLLKFFSRQSRREPLFSASEGGTPFFIRTLGEDLLRTFTLIVMIVEKFQLLSDLAIRLDYRAKKLNLKKLVWAGQVMEALNLFDLEDAEITLPATTIRGAFLTDLPLVLLRQWLPFIRSTHLSSLIGGIKGARSVSNVGGGVADLVLLPIHQYRRGGRLFKGLRRGLASFLRSTTVEGTRLGSNLAYGTRNLLANETFTGGKPASLVEGIFGAVETLQATQQEISTIIAVPLRVYEQGGTSGKVTKSALRAVPLIVLKSVLGVSEATGHALVGVHHTLVPERGAEVRQRYKEDRDRNDHQQEQEFGESI